MTTQTDPAETMRDEAQRILGQSIDCYVMDPDTMDYDPDHEAGVHIAFLAERGFEIRRRDAAAGSVCVSREDLGLTVELLRGKDPVLKGIHQMVGRFRAALGETE